ncbi:MAG: hypothetical protein E7639_05525 [Ruminococcaceae bacterium]|nr:hypothetical protein [Oscillospiraceae bacterium]
MGFGLLLVGYFFTSVMPVISIFSAAMLLGYPLISLGLFRLCPYHKRFYYAFFASLPAPLFGLYYTASSLVRAGVLTGGSFLGGTAFAVVEWLYFVYAFVLIALVLWAVASLATQMELFQVQSAAWRNLTFLAIYQVIYLIIKLPIPHAAAFVLPITILRYLCIFLNVWLFFRCYRFILPEGSDNIEMPPKKGGN